VRDTRRPPVVRRPTAGVGRGVTSTPTVFGNGRRFSGAQPYEVFVAAIDEELTRAAGR